MHDVSIMHERINVTCISLLCHQGVKVDLAAADLSKMSSKLACIVCIGDYQRYFC